MRTVTHCQCQQCQGVDYLTALRRLTHHPRLRAKLPEWPDHKAIRVVTPHLPPCTSIDQRAQMELYVGVVEAGVLSPFVPTLQETLRSNWMIFES